MSVQPQPLPTPDTPQPPAAPPLQAELNYVAPPAAAPAPNQHAPIWFQRMSLFILVIFCIYLGVIVAVLPWLRSLWEFNSYFMHHPRLWAVLRLGPVRGMISGVGLLDIWIGVSEAINYRDQRS